MQQIIKVSIIGLDSSHTIQFARRMQAPDCPADQKVNGLRAVSCLRFPTPFQDEDGLNARQKQIEEWGVKVTTKFEEAVADCDALMLEINDPSLHLEYFTRCVGLGKIMFLDKPLADTLANGRKINTIIKSKNVKVFSSSSLRFVPQLENACREMPSPLFATVYGPLGDAPAGSAVVWYGVHSFEMLQRAMGRGAQNVLIRKDALGVIAMIAYSGGRRGVVELNNDSGIFGGCLRNKEKAVPFQVDMTVAYRDLLIKVAEFFHGGAAPVAMEDTLEIMAMLDAARRSHESGKEETI